MTMQIRKMYLNATNLGVIGETDWSDVDAQTRDELFAELQKEHGSPEPMYLDVHRSPSPAAPDAEHEEPDMVPGGWVFTTIESCEDDPTDTWKHETWVEVRDVEAEASSSVDLEAG